jgi:hypothetical protein
MVPFNDAMKAEVFKTRTALRNIKRWRGVIRMKSGGVGHPSAAVKNPVREHGASSMEKAIYTRGRIAPKPSWRFMTALKSGAFWLFHVKLASLNQLRAGIVVWNVKVRL